MSNQNIIFKINNINYIKITDSNGIAKLTINLNPGTYTIYYSFAGQNNYQSCSGESSLSVSVEDTLLCPINPKLNQGTALNIKFTTNKGVPISGEYLSFTINGVNYNRITDSNGIGKININLNPGTYNIKIGYTSPDLSKYKSITPINCNLNVFSTNQNQYSLISLSNYVIKGDTYKVKLTDSNGNALANKKINFWINQNEYSRTTDSNGIAKMNINLNPKIYGISANYGESSITAKLYETILVTTGEMNQGYSSTTDGPLSQYRQSTNYQCLNNQYITSLANNLTKTCSNDLEKINAIHNYIYSCNYRDYGNGLNNAYNTALLFTGNCYDQTNLFMSLAKSSGLTVRGILGVSSNLNSGHAWAQVYLNNRWVVSDPTSTEMFGSWSAAYNGDYFSDSRQRAYAFEKEIYVLPIPNNFS